jgi:hypothetical protein
MAPSGLKLEDLVGEDLWGAEFAAQMLMLQFGSRRSIPSRKGGGRDVGEYALHIQCIWKASAAGAPISDMKDYLAQRGPLRVSSITYRYDGGLAIEFSGPASLLVEPSPDSLGEQWRLLKPGTSVSHLVYEGGHLTYE